MDNGRVAFVTGYVNPHLTECFVDDIVEDGETGILAPEGDIGAFAAAVARLLEDEPWRKAMGLAASRKVASCHGIESVARALDRALSGAPE